MNRRFHIAIQVPKREPFIGSGVPGDNWLPLCGSMQVQDAVITPEGRMIPYPNAIAPPSLTVCPDCQRIAWDRWADEKAADAIAARSR